jgi:hypothetical protein
MTTPAEPRRPSVPASEELDGAVCWLAATCTACGALIEGGTCWNCGARRADEWGVRPGTAED